jgi:hypothetical protein
MKKIVTLLAFTVALCAADTLSVSIGATDVITKSGYTRLLVRFDLSQIPESSRVCFAQLFAPIQPIDSFDLDVRRVTTPWARGHVTWTRPWHNPGGDFDTVMPGLFSYRYGFHRGITVDITPTVQWWVNGASNCGLLLRPAFGAQVGFIRLQGPLQTLANARIRVLYYPIRQGRGRDLRSVKEAGKDHE